MAKTPGSKARILKFLLENVGSRVTSADLHKASGGASEWGRRVRELRDEKGYLIRSHNDDATLKPGEYILISADPGVVNERGISAQVRAFVLTRDGQTCQTCGAEAGQQHPADPGKKVILQLGHIVDKSAGGTDDPENLRAQCTLCNQGLQNTGPMRPSLKRLLTDIRKATNADQREIQHWLNTKFRVDED